MAAEELLPGHEHAHVLQAFRVMHLCGHASLRACCLTSRCCLQEAQQQGLALVDFGDFLGLPFCVRARLSQWLAHVLSPERESKLWRLVRLPQKLNLLLVKT